jgi:hypothetical protein
MESRKFQKSNMNSATGDVLWDMDYHPLGSTFVSYAHTRISTRVYIVYYDGAYFGSNCQS